mmetsp:Transcript_74970/g.160527  ORF Transcript_74970/g.160527 Transcript_74970/m.160527 type:complete len:219 (-) Transcript_74970:1276-1932(-)
MDLGTGVEAIKAELSALVVQGHPEGQGGVGEHQLHSLQWHLLKHELGEALQFGHSHGVRHLLCRGRLIQNCTCNGTQGHLGECVEQRRTRGILFLAFSAPNNIAMQTSEAFQVRCDIASLVKALNDAIALVPGDCYEVSLRGGTLLHCDLACVKAKERRHQRNEDLPQQHGRRQRRVPLGDRVPLSLQLQERVARERADGTPRRQAILVQNERCQSPR